MGASTMEQNSRNVFLGDNIAFLGGKLHFFERRGRVGTYHLPQPYRHRIPKVAPSISLCYPSSSMCILARTSQ